MDYLTAYKKLDNLCKDILKSDKGITTYISTMETKNGNNIPNWQDDFKTLKHYRHIRNQLVHDDDVFQKDICTSSDVRWLNNFYKRLLNHQDPLSLYNKNRRKIKRKKSFLQKLFPYFFK